MVRWSDLNLYQGKQLLPDGKGKESFPSHCLVCHGFETRMAATTRDADGWRDRVNYMREAMSFTACRTFTDEDENSVVATIYSTVFGPDSVVPRSPADLPAYKSLVRTYSDEAAMKIVYVEYELPAPTRAAWSAAPDKNGDLWMPYYGRGNKIARLDPQTGEVQEYPGPRAANSRRSLRRSDGRRQRLVHRVCPQQNRQIRSRYREDQHLCGYRCRSARRPSQR